MFLYLFFLSNVACFRNSSSRVIVKLNDCTQDLSSQEFLRPFFDLYPTAEIVHKYEHVFRGFAVDLSTSDQIDGIEYLNSNENVDYVHYENMGSQLDVQTNAPWNLARISQRGLENLNYYFDKSAGSGVNIYILDSGISKTHTDFGKRVMKEVVFTGERGSVLNGHGTHVAGIAAGKTYGVAKQANIISVRVVDNSGSIAESDALAGMDWILADSNTRKGAGVINMSWGIADSMSLSLAVSKLKMAKFSLFAAAGNIPDPDCQIFPASYSEVISVGASDTFDNAWGAYGPCVDIFAPGTSILSAWLGSDTASMYLTGTSMSSPHAAGVAALFLSQEKYQVESIQAQVLNYGTRGILNNVEYGTSNILLFSNPPSSIVDEAFLKQD